MNNGNITKKLMTHIVLGYPDFNSNRELIKTMSDAGVDYIEMQIPFTDPIADGPTIMNANQDALKQGISITGCLDFASDITAQYKNINFLFMTYYNIIFNAGVDNFVRETKKAGLYGIISPDIPFDEDNEGLFRACRENMLNGIYVFSPTTSTARLKKISDFALGFVYCTSRIGITGAEKDQHKHLGEFVSKAKKIIHLPVAVGFGIDSAEKANKISEYADIIIIGSKIINIVNQSGSNFQKNVYDFLSEVKKSITI